MLICYLDDSDATSSSVITLAGYVQTESAWRSFEVHAAKVYSAYAVDVLHATDFHSTKKCFKGWSYVKKRSFIDDLYAEMTELLGISHSVPKQKYKEQQKSVPEAQRMSAYGYAFNAMVGGFVNSSMTREAVESFGLSFVVERGHKNDADLQREFADLLQIEGSEKLRSFEFSGKDGSHAIQLADLFAFYSRRQAAKMAVLTSPTVEQSRELEEKMFSLITSKQQHVTAILDDPLLGGFVPYDDYRQRDIDAKPPGNHMFSVGQRPTDPTV